MSDSLRDQLLKAGFASKPKTEAKPARLANKPHFKAPPRLQQQSHPKPPQQPQPKPARNPSGESVNLAHAYALRAKQEKEEREREQREVERVAREKKERKQKLLTLLDGKSLNAADADVPRHFPHGNKIRRVYCMADQLAKLNRGELAVVQLAGRYLLVDREIGIQCGDIQPESLVLLCDPNAPAEDDVPADLMW